MKDSVSPVAHLYDRVQRARAQDRGIHFSPEDVDWLVLTGAYARLLEAVAREAYVAARDRMKERGYELDDRLFGLNGPVNAPRAAESTGHDSRSKGGKPDDEA